MKSLWVILLLLFVGACAPSLKVAIFPECKIIALKGPASVYPGQEVEYQIWAFTTADSIEASLWNTTGSEKDFLYWHGTSAISVPDPVINYAIQVVFYGIEDFLLDVRVWNRWNEDSRKRIIKCRPLVRHRNRNF